MGFIMILSGNLLVSNYTHVLVPESYGIFSTIMVVVFKVDSNAHPFFQCSLFKMSGYPLVYERVKKAYPLLTPGNQRQNANLICNRLIFTVIDTIGKIHQVII